jgi:P4 family phage/plasmid primase-like protien
MSVHRFDTLTQRDLFGLWKNEVDSKINAIVQNSTLQNDNAQPIYIVFAGYDYVYVYFPTTTYNENQVTYMPKDIEHDSTPVYCSHDVDMSLVSFADFTGISDVFYSEYAIEDISITDVISHVISCSTIVPQMFNHSDKEINYMCMFVNLALHESDTRTLLSYIKHAVISKGYPDFLDDDIPPVKYTMLEARSEMKRCNQELYTAYKHKLISEMLNDAKETKSKAEMEYKVSGIAFEILFDSVVNCAGTTWCFIDGLWKECSQDAYIWNFLTTEFIEYLVESKADAIAKHLMSVHIRSRIMKDIKMRLQNDNFYELLDSKRDIIRMTNGVYNTYTEKLSVPLPNDYVSVTAGVPYQVFDEKSYKVSRLMQILSTIFPDPKILNFFILSCSTFLEGYNNPKVFYIWWGMGNNAKSLVQSLVMKTFGEYCSTAPTSLVTGKRTDSSNATPELCHVEKRLVVFLQEPNPEEKIKAGKMKEMTGNDSMYIRQLFKSGKTMVLKAKIVIVCNNIIDIPGMDAAIRRRVVVIPFVSTFLDPAEYEAQQKKGTLEPNTQIIDLSVEKELIQCKDAFMYILCRRYREWVNNERMLLNIPEVIKNKTEYYVTHNNYQLRFIKKYIHHINGSTVAAYDIYELFKEWFRKSGYPVKKIPDFEKFTNEMSNEGYFDDGNGIIRDVFVSYNGEHMGAEPFVNVAN